MVRSRFRRTGSTGIRENNRETDFRSSFPPSSSFSPFALLYLEATRPAASMGCGRRVARSSGRTLAGGGLGSWACYWGVVDKHEGREECEGWKGKFRAGRSFCRLSFFVPFVAFVVSSAAWFPKNCRKARSSLPCPAVNRRRKGAPFQLPAVCRRLPRGDRPAPPHRPPLASGRERAASLP